MAAFVKKDSLTEDIRIAIEGCDGYCTGTGCPLSKILDNVEAGMYDWSGE